MRRLRYGMVGGGPDSFLGEAYRKAIRIDGQAELVAGIHVSCDKPLCLESSRKGNVWVEL